MEGIDTSDWRPFVIGDLFERLQLSVKSETFNKTLDVSEVRTEEFNLPLVNAKHGNNGIMFYGRENDFETAEMTIDIVQNGAIATGDVYAQPQRTGVLWDAYLIKPKVPVASEYTLMFLATVIEKAIKKHFSYADKCVWDKASALTILLPVTEFCEPDYDYMEKYMKGITQCAESALDTLLAIDHSFKGVDTSEWTDFVIGDLFDIHPTKSYKMTNNELLEDDGENPVIVNTGFNNGVGGFTNQKCTEQAGVITFTDTAAKSTDSFFYQDADFVGYPHVQGMYAKTHVWTKYEALFLTSVIKSYLRGRYDFISKMTRTDIMNLTVKLPATASGEPDYGYMGAYIKNIITVANDNFSILL